MRRFTAVAIQTELTFEATSRKEKVGDLTLHWNEAGTGDQVLIALHGSGPGASAWSNFKGNLPVFADQFRTLLIDQPGFGRSDKPKVTGSTMTHAAKAIVALMDKLKIEKAHFLGNSYGGGVAARITIDHPERVEKLVLMGPGGIAHVIFSPDPTEGISILREFLTKPTRESLERFVRIMVYDQKLVTPELLEERWSTVNDKDTFEGFKRVAMPDVTPEEGRRIREENDLWRHLEKVSHQVLMIWGRDDRVVPMDSAFLALRRLRNSRLHIFSRCGHWAQVEKKDEFNRLVVDFLTH
jgi:4,5:9,10-diseco-3-hydroxy-5,9,17-trioxoandrosta-1(10),2-diene-4-oate hydrolase